MNEAKLKACPFCGGEAYKIGDRIQVKHSRSGLFYIKRCPLLGNVFHDFDAEVWNTRAGDREPDAAPNAGKIAGSISAIGWAAQTWWPECPWPEDVWLNTLAEISPKYVELVKDENLRTRISGVIMRHGWRLAEKEIIERLEAAGIVPPNDQAHRPRQ